MNGDDNGDVSSILNANRTMSGILVSANPFFNRIKTNSTN